jgi:hypothetical protein
MGTQIRAPFGLSSPRAPAQSSMVPGRAGSVAVAGPAEARQGAGAACGGPRLRKLCRSPRHREESWPDNGQSVPFFSSTPAISCCPSTETQDIADRSRESQARNGIKTSPSQSNQVPSHPPGSWLTWKRTKLVPSLVGVVIPARCTSPISPCVSCLDLRCQRRINDTCRRTSPHLGSVCARNR